MLANILEEYGNRCLHGFDIESSHPILKRIIEANLKNIHEILAQVDSPIVREFLYNLADEIAESVERDGVRRTLFAMPVILASGADTLMDRSLRHDLSMTLARCWAECKSISIYGAGLPSLQEIDVTPWEKRRWLLHGIDLEEVVDPQDAEDDDCLLRFVIGTVAHRHPFPLPPWNTPDGPDEVVETILKHYRSRGVYAGAPTRLSKAVWSGLDQHWRIFLESQVRAFADRHADSMAMISLHWDDDLFVHIGLYPDSNDPGRIGAGIRRRVDQTEDLAIMLHNLAQRLRRAGIKTVQVHEPFPPGSDGESFLFMGADDPVDPSPRILH